MAPFIKTHFQNFIVNTNGCFDDVEPARGPTRASVRI